MNKIRISAYMMTLLAAGFASCSNDDTLPGGSPGQTVHMTVDVSRSTDGTRSTLSQQGDDLTCAWTDSDKLLVTSTDGTPLGVLSVKNINEQDNSQATFEGKLENVPNTESLTVNYIYLGNKGDYASAPENKLYVKDYSAQNGTIEGLSDHDMMTVQKNVKVENGSSYVSSVELERRVSFARFKLNLPDGASFDKSTTVTVSGTGVNKALSVNGGSLEAAYTEGSMTIATESNDFYMTLLPNTVTSFDLTFTVSTANATYEGVYKVSKPIAEGKFYRKDNDGNPIEVSFSKIPTPYNPGDMGSWGGPNIEPEATDIGVTFVSETDGWTLNWRSVYSYGGFGTYIRFDHNGMINGHLTSKGGTSLYYQWGRWLGLPASCGYLYLNSQGSYTGGYKVQSQLPLGVNDYNTKIGYCFANSLSAAHGQVYMGGDSWTNERALRSSIMFGRVTSLISHGDYVNKNEECMWEDRCGNPAPTGYRIPTAQELEAFIPTGGTVNTSKVEVKTINGEKYAFQWKVIAQTSSSVAKLQIRSFKTTDDTVSLNDSRFDSAPMVTLMCYGYLDNEGDQQSYGEVGVYWSNETGKLASGENGGKYLELYINGSTANLEIGTLWRSFGGMVLLIHDDTKVQDSLTPWFPLTGI